MVKRLAIAAVTLLAVEGVAWACSCIDTNDPGELRTYAGESVDGAVALVEARTETAYSPERGGETMTVTRTLAGTAPKAFKVERGNFPSGASCDVLYEAGSIQTVILYPTGKSVGTMPVLRTSDLCAENLLTKPVFKAAVVAALARPRPEPERG